MAVAIALVEDLMFLSRIREAAKGKAVEVRAVRTPQALVDACRSETPALVLVDLDGDRLQPIRAAELLRADARSAALPLVGFVSHVNGSRAQEAQAAGYTRVLSRGAFVQELPALLETAAPR
jgi:DNA-binding NarL/FixJ family response regulator